MTLPKDYPIHLVGDDKYDLTVDYVFNDLPVNITGETVTFKIYSDKVLLLTLTSGSGLTITPLTGRIVISLIGNKLMRHVLRLDTPAEKTLMYGKVEVYQRV